MMNINFNIVTNVLKNLLQTTSRQDIPTRLTPQASQNQQVSGFTNHQAAVTDGPSNREKQQFGELSKIIPPFKDYHNHLHTYQYLQQLENLDIVQPRHNEIIQQYSSSTDEGCDTDHGGEINFN